MVSKKILLAIGFFLFFILFFVDKSYAWSSTYSDWQYRKEITITEQSGDTQTDYQVKLTIDTASLISQGKMNSDCSDMRFTDENDNPLPYWIESGCNSANTIVWVKVPEIPANNNTTIYMYYGNPNAESESNPDNVFELYDDFEDGITDWTEFASEGTYEEVDGVVHLVAPGYDSESIRNDQTFNYGYALEASVKPEADTWSGFGFTSADAENVFTSNNFVGFYFGSDGAKTRIRINGVNSNLADYFSVSTTEYKLYQIFWKSSDSVDFYYDGNLIDSRNEATPSEDLYVGITGSDDSDIWVDWVRVRKFADPEPTYSIGAEETNGGETNQPPQITIYSPSNTTYYGITNIDLKFVVEDTDNQTISVQALYDGNVIYSNSSYTQGENVTINQAVTQGSHCFEIEADDGINQVSQTRCFYVWHGIKVNAYYANNTNLINYELVTENSTMQINFTVDSADYYIEWKDLPQGDVSLSVADKDYDAISIKVNDSMLVVDVNFYDTKPPIINVSEDFAYGLFSSRPLENVSIVATDGVSDTVWCEVNDVEFTNSYNYSFYADDLVSIEITCNDGGNEASVSKTYDFVYYDINIYDERTKEPFDFSSIDNMDMIVTFSDDTTKSYSISNSTVYIVENQSDYAEPVYVTALVKYGNPPTTYLRKYYTTGGLIDMYLLNPNSGTICFMTGYIGQGVDYDDVVELKYLGTTVAQNKFDVEGKVIFYIYEGSEYDVCIDKGLYTSCVGKVDSICNSIFFINLPLEFSTLIHAPRIPVVDIFDEDGLLVVTFEDPLGRNNTKNIVITDQDGNVVLNSSFTDAIYQYSFNATDLNVTSVLVSVKSDDGEINILRSYAYPHKLNMPSFQGWGKLLFLLMMVIVPAGLILAEAFSLLRQGMSLILSGIYLLVNAAVWAEYTNLMVGFGVLLLGIGLALTLKKK